LNLTGNLSLAKLSQQLVFGPSLASIAVAVALSFGLGGREAAGRHMEHLLNKLREED